MRRKKIIFASVTCIILLVYFWLIRTPLYKGQLTIDLNNMSVSTVQGATLEYETPNKIILLPDIRPWERIIVIPPYDICEKSLKTRIFINYNGIRKELIGEFYSIYGDSHNSDVFQSGQAKIRSKKIEVSKTNAFKRFFHLKPYIRVIDMNSK